MSDVFKKLSSSLISSEFIESLITAITITNDDKLLFLSQKAFENGFYDDPFIIQDETLRFLLKKVSLLRAKGADEIAIKEFVAQDGDKFKVFVDILDRMKKKVTSDMFLNDIFLEKIRNQVVVKNLQSIGNSLTDVKEETKTSTLLRSLEEILTRMLVEMNINLDFREMTIGEIKKRIDTRKKRGEAGSKVRVPTGLTFLDDVLKGGIEKGRLAVIASSPGYGKSTVVAHCAVQAAKHGFNAWIITLENSLIETWARVDASITDVEIDNLDSMSVQVEEKVKQFANDSYHGELLIKEFPPDSMTVTMLKNYIVQKVSQGYQKPDIIFVDYLDIIKSEKHYAQLRFELAHVTKSLKNLASNFDCVVVVPTQLNRGAVDEDGASKGGLGNLAEAFAKSFEPDLLLVIRQSKREIREDKLRLFIAKSRISKSRMEVVCEVNYAKMRLKSINLQFPGDDDLSMIEDNEEFALTNTASMMEQIEKKMNKE